MATAADGSNMEFYKSGSNAEKLASGIEEMMKEKYGMDIHFDLSGDGKAAPLRPLSSPNKGSQPQQGSMIDTGQDDFLI